MALSQEEIRKVALLARLELTDAELERQAKHINDLIAYFEVLKGVDVTGVEPTSHSIPVYNVFREDTVTPSLSREEVLQNAPEARDGFFIVPRIVEA